MTYVQQLWQLILLWGVVLGVATGITPALGASIASRWFVDRRGLAVGIMTNANAAGQIVFLPLLMSVIVVAGWRNALMMITATACLLIPAIWFWMRDRPSEVGLEPYRSGAGANAKSGKSFARGEIRPMSFAAISEVMKTSTFWILAGCFFICGVTANGLIGTHLIPHAIERGIPQVTAATAVGIMGGASFIGTTVSGYLVDRIDPRKVLSVVYGLRGTALLMLPFVSNAVGSVHVRCIIRARLVRLGTSDHDHDRAEIRFRKSWPNLRHGLCFSSAGRSGGGHRRRLGARSLWRLSKRLLDRRLLGFGRRVLGADR